MSICASFECQILMILLVIIHTRLKYIYEKHGLLSWELYRFDFRNFGVQGSPLEGSPFFYGRNLLEFCVFRDADTI